MRRDPLVDQTFNEPPLVELVKHTRWRFFDYLIYLNIERKIPSKIDPESALNIRHCVFCLGRGAFPDARLPPWMDPRFEGYYHLENDCPECPYGNRFGCCNQYYSTWTSFLQNCMVLEATFEGARAWLLDHIAWLDAWIAEINPCARSSKTTGGDAR